MASASRAEISARMPRKSAERSASLRLLLFAASRARSSNCQVLRPLASTMAGTSTRQRIARLSVMRCRQFRRAEMRVPECLGSMSE
jgi:hypothetical protein